MAPLPAPPVPVGTRTALAVLTAPPTDVVHGIAVTRTGCEPGSAPTLLLIHGVGAARLAWAPILGALARRYDVVVVDLPGHGESDPLQPGDDARCRALGHRLAVACAELAVARPHVVGNSLGGWIGLEMAADGNAASLTALAPAGLRLVPRPATPVLYANRALARLTGPVTDPLLGLWPVRSAALASGSADPGRLEPELARGVARALRESTDYETMLAATRHVRFERGNRITVPTTVVFGDRDRILGRDQQCRDLLPADVPWIVLPRCGHAPMWDAPQRTVEIIDEVVGRG